MLFRSAEGTTVLLVEQNAFKALSIAKRAYILETGRIIKSDDGVTGLLVSDPIELQAALQRLLIDDDFRETLGSAAQLKAQDYSWEETGRRFADTLEAMVKIPSGMTMAK